MVNSTIQVGKTFVNEVSFFLAYGCAILFQYSVTLLISSVLVPCVAMSSIVSNMAEFYCTCVNSKFYALRHPLVLYYSYTQA